MHVPMVTNENPRTLRYHASGWKRPKVDREPSCSFSMLLTAQAMATCSEMRPSVDISVGGDDSDVGVGAGGARTEYRSAVATAAA